MTERRAVIFANGPLPDPEVARRLLREDDFRIAADGGHRHALACGCVPDVLIGDLDSITEPERESLRRSGVRIQSFPAEKDENDLELAVAFAVREGFTCIRILAGLGGRTDQTLANLSLLADPALDACDVRIDDGREEAMRVGNKTVVRGNPGDIVSLLPFGVAAQGVVTEGLKYPLCGEDLLPHKSRGVSNRMLSDAAVVSAEKGVLICIHIRSVV
jgi:thiamine pyrophosphokinase